MTKKEYAFIRATDGNISCKSLTGACIHIAEGETKSVPISLVAQAVEQGGISVEGDAPTTEKVPEKEPGVATIPEVVDAITQLIANGKAEQFTATGIPRVPEINALLGDKKTDKATVDQVWETQFQSS